MIQPSEFRPFSLSYLKHMSSYSCLCILVRSSGVMAQHRIVHSFCRLESNFVPFAIPADRLVFWNSDRCKILLEHRVRERSLDLDKV